MEEATDSIHGQDNKAKGQARALSKARMYRYHDTTSSLVRRVISFMKEITSYVFSLSVHSLSLHTYRYTATQSHLGEHALGVLLVKGDRAEGNLDEHLIVGAAGALAWAPATTQQEAGIGARKSTRTV